MDTETLEDLAPAADLRPLTPQQRCDPGHDAAGTVRSVLPGLGLVGVYVAAAYLIAQVVPSISPLVAAVAIGTAVGNAQPDATLTKRLPILPLFVVAFLLAIVLRSASVVPPGWLPTIKTAETLTLAAALVGLGTGTQVAKLRRLGGRPLLLALLSWLLVAAAPYVGVMAVGA